MQNHVPISDIANKKVLVVCKQFPLPHGTDQNRPFEDENFSDHNLNFAQEIKRAQEKNLQCIESVKDMLKKLAVQYRVIYRSEITTADLLDHFVITVGGDGTLLDTSHYCSDSPILGVNSDPSTSIGALCAANESNLWAMLQEIYSNTLKPSRVCRLQVSVDGKDIKPLALNEILFCHKNPASMTRFALTLRGRTESHRSSGIWVATAAGSTGAIFSAGATPLPFDEQAGIFRLREPYWSASEVPELLDGKLSPQDSLLLRCNTTDAQIYIDGPHKIMNIAQGQEIKIAIASQPLWLFNGPNLLKNRARIIEQRRSIRIH